MCGCLCKYAQKRALSLTLPKKRLQVVDFYGFKNAELPLSHLWEREPRRGGRGCSCWEKHPLPNPLPPVGEGTNSGVFGCVCGAIFLPPQRKRSSTRRASRASPPPVVRAGFSITKSCGAMPWASRPLRTASARRLASSAFCAGLPLAS
jgi:hypothetical protein